MKRNLLVAMLILAGILCFGFEESVHASTINVRWYDDSCASVGDSLLLTLHLELIDTSPRPTYTLEGWSGPWDGTSTDVYVAFRGIAVIRNDGNILVSLRGQDPGGTYDLGATLSAGSLIGSGKRVGMWPTPYNCDGLMRVE